MNSIVHLLIGILFVFIFGLIGLPAIIFILASVLIDLDHILELKNTKIKIEQDYKEKQRSLHIFHTFEVIALTFLISIYFIGFIYIALAFFVHLLVDAVGNLYFRNIKKQQGFVWLKYWFLAYYIKKRSLWNK